MKKTVNPYEVRYIQETARRYDRRKRNQRDRRACVAAAIGSVGVAAGILFDVHPLAILPPLIVSAAALIALLPSFFAFFADC
jgi:fatty acid desaturase